MTEQRYRPAYGVFDSRLITQDGAKLGAIGIALYCVLLTYAPNPCPSQATMAKELGCTVPTIRKYLQKLQMLGWIEIEVNFNPDTKTYDSNTYNLLHKFEGVVKEVYQGSKPSLQESSSSGDDEIDENEELPPYRLHEICFGFTPSFTVLQRLTELIEEYTYSWVKEAMEIAANQGKPKIAYVEGILRNWRLNGKDTEKPDPIPDWVDPAYRGTRKQY